eukprot:GHVP01022482.1.p1 GENE.GHVP01022482.1~~GHVP01022482.1.p1  ORF type:complete len:296 (-),score=48.05 GHVP01022482.1:83-970(-)
MEFKLLSDQLNSACEDHFGIPQQFVQDELHQGISLEPQFQGIQQPDVGLFYTVKPGTTYSNLDWATDGLVDGLKIVLKNEFDLFQVSTDFSEDPDCLDEKYKEYNENNPTNFFISAKNANSKRHWTVLMCNCEQNMPQDMTEMTEIPECGSGNSCYKFDITWNPSQSWKGKTDLTEFEVFRGLWRTFDMLSNPCILELPVHYYDLFDPSFQNGKGNLKFVPSLNEAKVKAKEKFSYKKKTNIEFNLKEFFETITKGSDSIVGSQQSTESELSSQKPQLKRLATDSPQFKRKKKQV